METVAIITSCSSPFHHHWRNFNSPDGAKGNQILPAKLHKGFGATIKSFAGRNPVKRSKGNGKLPKSRNQELNKISSDEYIGFEDKSFSKDDSFSSIVSGVSSTDNTGEKRNAVLSSSRSDVLQACTVTSGLILASGVLIRYLSHLAYGEGWPLHDCTKEVIFHYETWHIELIIGLVIGISSCRFLLLKTWPDFAESSEAANQQILSKLEPLDYIVVAFLPGISEEVLFRGALMPLFGLDWKSALVVATIFGVLHLGSGRKYSFAVWATFVGFAYGYATIVTSSIIVPVASHALNNLIGGILWRVTSNKSQQQKLP